MASSKEVISKMIDVYNDGKVKILSQTKVYATKPGLGTCRQTASKEYTWPAVTHVFERIVVSWKPEQFLANDYIIDDHRYFEPCMPPKEFTLIAGNKPQWMEFGHVWHDWVKNPDVVDSAVRHLVSRQDFKKLIPLLETCLRFESIESATMAWKQIVDIWVFPNARTNLHRYLNRSSFSPIVLASMPVKLAMRSKTWKPPVQLPQLPKRPSNLIEISLATD